MKPLHLRRSCLKVLERTRCRHVSASRDRPSRQLLDGPVGRRQAAVRGVRRRRRRQAHHALRERGGEPLADGVGARLEGPLLFCPL